MRLCVNYTDMRLSLVTVMAVLAAVVPKYSIWHMAGSSEGAHIPRHLVDRLGGESLTVVIVICSIVHIDGYELP
jgi:hypothetical protein